ncbi:pentapeptide repeat-containing protein [Streptomyces venetus]|uniref:pentapeptide repeat-containing protein n=1 Tax=Streptomyces venetus TaxID=1701086 RepID=UPI003C2C4CCD
MLFFFLAVGMPWLVIKAPYVIDAEYIDKSKAREGSAALITGLRSALVACVAATGAGIALFYTARTYKLTRRGQVTERFTKALERLGADDDKTYVRIGGILAMEQIVQDAPEQATHAAQVFAQFIRMRTNATEHDPAVKNPRPTADVQLALTALTRPTSRTHVQPDERLDLSNLCLAGANLHGADLRDADVRGANLRDAHLGRADLQSADLTNADLTDASLSDASLRKARLLSADLRGAFLLSASLRGASLGSASLRGASLESASLRGAHLWNADLREADFQDADLRDAGLREADLREAELVKANLYKADLRDADLREADLRAAHLYKADLRNTNLQDDPFPSGGAAVTRPSSCWARSALGCGTGPNPSMRASSRPSTAP